MHIIDANELNDPRYKANPYNRCFFCKENLYSTIKLNLDGTIFSGANVDDLNDFRPGLDALKMQMFYILLLIMDLIKNIRKLAKEITELFSDLPLLHV